MQQSNWIELWVGVFVGLGLIALFFLAMQVSNLAEIKTDDRGYTITARFENAGSLKPKAPVTMAGVRIGRVNSVSFDKDSYEAVVEMRIDTRYDTLPDDTTASILTQGLLGEQYVGLSPGGSTNYLKDGDEIELTQSAMVLEQVISRFLFNKAEGDAEKKNDKRDDIGGEMEVPLEPRAAATSDAADGHSALTGETSVEEPSSQIEAVPELDPPATP